MKKNIFFLISLAVFLTGNEACKKEGCTDFNAANYNTQAKKNKGCQYRFVSTIEVSGVPARKQSGDSWDEDGSGPDLKLNFGKNSSMGYDFTTEVKIDSLSAVLISNLNTPFTDEVWKFELIDDDTLADSDIILVGTFHPLQKGQTGNFISVGSDKLKIHINYIIH